MHGIYVYVFVFVFVFVYVLSTPLTFAILTTFMPVSLLFLRLDLSSRLCARVDFIKTIFPDPVILNLFAADFLVLPAFAMVVTARLRPTDRAPIHSEDVEDAMPTPCANTGTTPIAVAEQHRLPLLQQLQLHRQHALHPHPRNAADTSNRPLAAPELRVLITVFSTGFVKLP